MKFYDQAVEDYTRAIQKDSEYLIFYIGRTDAYAAIGQKVSVVEDLNVVFEKETNSQTAALLIAGRKKEYNHIRPLVLSINDSPSLQAV